MLIDQGVLARSPDGWSMSGDLDELPIPPTIHPLLTSRLRTSVGPDAQLSSGAPFFR
jgi:hypothetical protein